MLNVTEVLAGIGVGSMVTLVYYLMYISVKKARARREGNKPQEKEVILGALMAVDVSHDTTPKIRIGVIQAMNGRILEVATATPLPGPHQHHDWKTEMYVVPEDQKLSEAISTVMLMKGLEQ